MLDERLESVSQGIKDINSSIEVLTQQSQKTPTPSADEKPSENVLILRKHATMLAEWESVQKEVQVLREELKEDKWLTVFRTVTEQADGMMSSLEKAVNRCQVCRPGCRVAATTLTFDTGLHMASATERSRRVYAIEIYIQHFCSVGKDHAKY